MIESLKARLIIVFISLAMAIIWMAPNFHDFGDKWWFTKRKMVYGLDIQGGLHLVMGVDIEGVLREEAVHFANSLKEYMKEKGSEPKEVITADAAKGEFSVVLQNAEDLEKTRKFIEENYSQQLQILSAQNDTIHVRYYDNYLNDRKQKVVGQSIETLRNRIDEFGVAEPSITAQGDRRILIQLPGIEDAARAKDLINRTARLDFMLVEKSVPYDKLYEMVQKAEEKGGYKLGPLPYTAYVERLNTDLKPELPANTMVLFERAANAKTLEAGAVPYLVRTDTNLGGDELQDAYVTNDEYGAWQVAMNFNPTGGKKFADLTEANVGELTAIVLDKVIYSAPKIISKIPNGRSVITLGQGGGDPQKVFQEAQLIATALRAGALPAALEQLEERTVGPTLGADSIALGKKAAMLGSLLVFVFMVVYYKAFGFIANVALIFNILILFAVLTSLGATLTLPGVAGVALTLGMSIDNNVIINERIKEELRKGASLAMAIKEGYTRSFWSIFDGNVTTSAACLILMYYGTGPIRGFAVSLLIGLTASLYTANFVTRAILDLLIVRFKVQRLPI